MPFETFLDKIVTMSDLETFQGLFSEKPIFSPKKSSFGRFEKSQEIISFYMHSRNICHSQRYWNIPRFFIEKTLFYQKKIKKWRFWVFLSSNTGWDTFCKNLSQWAILKPNKALFRNNPFFSQKNSNFERFERSWAIIPFDTHSRNICHSQQFLNIPGYFIGKTRFFQKKKRKK